MLVDFALLRPFEFELAPVFVHCVLALALVVVKPEVRKIVMIMNEKTFKISSLLRLYGTRVISSRVISVHIKLDKL